MRRTVMAVALALGSLWHAGAATAATLDFDDYSSGPAGVSLSLSEADLMVTSTTGNIFVFNSSQYAAPVQDGGAFCAVIGDGTFGDRCTGSASIVFLRPVQDVSFTALYVGPGDAATVSVFAGADLLGSVAITAAGQVLDFVGLAGITRIDFLDRSTPGPNILVDGLSNRVGTGIAYTGFAFEPVPDPPVEVTPVPLPAAGWMIASALAGLLLLRRRMQE